MLANWITLSRFPLLAAVLGMFHWGSPAVRLAAVGLLFTGLMLDTVDGVVARTRGETSLVGSVLDIAADRTYELVLWIWFAGIGMIPLAIPVIVAVRTTLTDALRSVGVAGGSAPLTQHRTALGLFLVNSTWMRTGYAVSKVLTFCGLGLALALANGELNQIAGILAWITTGFCVVRGLPVLAHAAREPAVRSQMGDRHA
jgi:CDP-diacylglycerol---glycerol-3-phosphate 3-phosphatidyltransferase